VHRGVWASCRGGRLDSKSTGLSEKIAHKLPLRRNTYATRRPVRRYTAAQNRRGTLGFAGRQRVAAAKVPSQSRPHKPGTLHFLSRLASTDSKFGVGSGAIPMNWGCLFVCVSDDERRKEMPGIRPSRRPERRPQWLCEGSDGLAWAICHYHAGQSHSRGKG
jgi:hypothetical protein